MVDTCGSGRVARCREPQAEACSASVGSAPLRAECGPIIGISSPATRVNAAATNGAGSIALTEGGLT